MKKLIVTLSAAALTAITFNIHADTGLLSPRATGNQIKHVSGIANDPDLVAVEQGHVAAPRTAGNSTVTVAGTAKEITPAMTCSRNITASPKAIQACATSPAAAMPCCGKSVATAN